MLVLLIAIFVVGYLAITLEQSLQINKTAIALLTGVLCWTIFALDSQQSIHQELSHHLSAIAEILFFLLGAMTIVELIDAHNGFEIITNRIKSRNPKVLLWLIGIITFFLSAILDNLTTAIVMVSLLRKILPASNDRKIIAGVVIIAANAGGSWSPIGDVTTTMLWIGGQITSLHIIKTLFIPSVLSLVVPLLLIGRQLGVENYPSTIKTDSIANQEETKSHWPILLVGFGGFLFVPVFKTIAHLPPYMGMLLVLGMIWVVSELIHKDKDEEERRPLTAAHALSRIDTSSVLFFLGILLSVAALEATHVLSNLAIWLNQTVGNLDIIVILIGLASAIVDNVPLVAASMGMYDLSTYPADHSLWTMLAYCAGTGGSILIIGSAAGVAVMGIEKIDFGWYLRNISWAALLGYLAGIGFYLLF
jgi:NhaD family Na+/H+ antiporter